jgi:hypothetical protein
VGDLDDAIRDHLELKRRRGADPAEVAREEQEALAPVTRGHAIVVPEAVEPAVQREDDQPRNGDQQHQPQAAEPPAHEDPGDATQEFRVEHGDAADWLDDDEES